MRTKISREHAHSHGPEALILNSGKVTNNGFIVGKAYDSIWFIGAPFIGLIVALIFLWTGVGDISVDVDAEQTYSIFDLFIGSFIASHLFIVFFRSHGNPEIFALHPIRFIAVPIVLIASMAYSLWITVFCSVLAAWWDVYHSSMQTFGLGRIYDMRKGNNPDIGRRLDYFLNLIIYAGPILAGASLVFHIYTFNAFRTIGFKGLGRDFPNYVFNHKNDLTLLILGIGIPFILYYIYTYWKLYKQGYAFSVQKTVLLAGTATISIFCWGFNSFGEAYFTMNFFHAWQYFAIVWAFEKKNITGLFGLSNFRNGRFLSLAIFVMVAFGYGYWATVYNGETQVFYSIILAVALLHFWYDSFIWSVRKKQV